jgi:gas vesicle protein
MERENGAAYMGIGMIAGMVIGLAVGVMYAPKPGMETRAMLKERAVDIKDKAAEVVENVKTRAGEMMHKTGSEEIRGCG